MPSISILSFSTFLCYLLGELLVSLNSRALFYWERVQFLYSIFDIGSGSHHQAPTMAGDALDEPYLVSDKSLAEVCTLFEDSQSHEDGDKITVTQENPDASPSSLSSAAESSIVVNQL